MLQVLAREIKQGKGIKASRLERNKTILAHRHDSLHRKFNRPNKKNLLKLISEFSKVAGYKINIQNIMHFY